MLNNVMLNTLTAKHLSFCCYSVLISTLLATFNALACDGQITPIAQKNTNNHYDVFNTGTYALQQDFTLETSTSCETQLVISTLDQSNSVTGFGQQLQFGFYASSGDSKSHQITFTPLQGDTSHSFSLRYLSGQYAAAGTLSNTLKAQLINKATQQVISEQEFELTTQVTASAVVYFSGLNERHTFVDLGALSSNKVISHLPTLRVISTSPYVVNFSSDGLGKLTHATGNPQWFIDYQLMVNQDTLELSNGKQKWQATQMTNQLGELISLSMRIGNTEEKPAGDYQDTIYISVLPELTIAP
ncbi:hypothetical protein ACPV5Q_11820 [Vibrio astriarenae]